MKTENNVKKSLFPNRCTGSYIVFSYNAFYNCYYSYRVCIYLFTLDFGVGGEVLGTGTYPYCLGIITLRNLGRSTSYIYSYISFKVRWSSIYKINKYF